MVARVGALTACMPRKLLSYAATAVVAVVSHKRCSEGENAGLRDNVR